MLYGIPPRFDDQITLINYGFQVIKKNKTKTHWGALYMRTALLQCPTIYFVNIVDCEPYEYCPQQGSALI
jgi:hypothetical protein